MLTSWAFDPKRFGKEVKQTLVVSSGLFSETKECKEQDGTAGEEPEVEAEVQLQRRLSIQEERRNVIDAAEMPFRV